MIFGMGGDTERPVRMEIDFDRLVDAITSLSRDVSGELGDHADNHILGGGDEIDGDKLDIDWNPSNSTPTVVATFTTDVDHLTSHLKGIDLALATKVGTHTLDATAVHTDVDAITEAQGQLLMRGATLWGALSVGLVGQPVLSGGAGADQTHGTLGTVYGGTGIDSSGATGFAKVASGTWSVSALTDNIEIHISGGGGVIPVGTYGPLPVDFACTITKCELYTDVAATTTVDIWKDTYANYPATILDTITAAAVPSTAGANKYQDVTLTGWTTAITAGDHLLYRVSANDLATRLTVSLRVTRNA